MKQLGCEAEVERKMGMQRSKIRRSREGKPMKETTNFIRRAVVRATQRTVRFTRWLRGQIYSEAPLRVSAVRLAAVRSG